MRPLRWAWIVGLLAAGLWAGSEPTPDQIVGAFERRTNRIRSFSADFVQRYTLGKLTRVESGRVYFQKPGRMRWEYTSPQDKLFLTDGEHAYLYVPEERQVRRTPIRQAPEWEAIFSLLIGRVDLSRLFGEVQVVRVHRLESPAQWQVRGLARSEKQPFQEVWLDLNDRYQLLRIEIRQEDGSLMEFHFRNWEEGQPLPATLFRLSVPPGTAWIEEGTL